ncbi:MAG TPA: GTP-binding protein [Chthonomonadales bacterium]|nr:GTP-binding protein [Chthonomonadales bacterium]
MPEPSGRPAPPRDIQLARPVTLALVGGFLGAGKTTAIRALASELERRGLRVGVVTNDQAPGLIDTLIGRRDGRPVAEVAGGCFCCRYEDMLDAVASLLPAEPDVLLCEPVGSCTDMAATVLNPFRAFYPEAFPLAPLTVLVDPARASIEVLEERPPLFGAEVGYILRKQLEEADAIALSKCDRVDDAEAARLAALLERRFGRPVLLTSATRGTGIARWADLLLSGKRASAHALTDIDYDTYALGEAALGWLNATVRLRSSAGFDGAALALALVEGVRAACAADSAQIAHLKVAIDAGKAWVRAHATATSEAPEAHGEGASHLAEAVLLVNARIAMEPEALEAAVRAVLQRVSGDLGVATEVETLTCFQPAYPRPPYRMASVPPAGAREEPDA